MTEADIQIIVERVLAELQQRPAALDSKPTALALFSGAMLGFEDSLESLKRLCDQVALDYVQTDAAKRILPQDQIEAVGMTPANQSLTSAHDMLIIPTLTVNLAAKVTHGVGDCLASNVVAEFIMTGKPVVVALQGACPDSKEKREWFPDMPKGYAAMLRQNMTTLKSFGVDVVDACQLDRAVLNRFARMGQLPEPVGAEAHGEAHKCSERLITAEIVNMCTEGSTLRINSCAIVTALAQDTARTRNVTLERI